MPPRIGQADQVVIARSKRTGERYATRTSHLSWFPDRRDACLHYTDNLCLDVCRCRVPHQHRKACSVSAYSSKLAIAITQYMEKFGLDSCHVPDFDRYRERQKIQWALQNVHAERFHYASKDKNVVCRCSNPDHYFYRRVHSPDIQELCTRR